MFITVNTNDGDRATVNTAQITHMTVAAFSGNGCKIYFASKDGLSVRETMDEILAKLGTVAA